MLGEYNMLKELDWRVLIEELSLSLLRCKPIFRAVVEENNQIPDAAVIISSQS